MSLYLLMTAVIAFIASLSASRLMVNVGLSDIPTGRSNHGNPTPTAGGVGVLCGIGAGFLALSFWPELSSPMPDIPAILSLAFAIAFVGFYDDLYAPPTGVKFGIFIGLAGLLIYVLSPVQSLPFGGGELALPFWLGALGTLLWIFVVTNGVNFMDGANGFMPGCLAIAFTALAVLAYSVNAPQTLWLSVICAAAWCGFLPWNARRKALIFAGDIGSLLAGFVFAAASLLFVRETGTAKWVYLAPLLLLPFIADVLLTLLWRAKHGKNLLRPHRDHIYQRAIRCGVSHRRISFIYYGAFTLCGAAAMGLTTVSERGVALGFAASLSCAVLVYLAGHLIWRPQD